MEENIEKANHSMCSNSDSCYCGRLHRDDALNEAEGGTSNVESISEELSSHGYKYMQCIGSGAFGIVVLARDMNISSHPLVALKLLPRGKFVSLKTHYFTCLHMNLYSRRKTPGYFSGYACVPCSSILLFSSRCRSKTTGFMWPVKFCTRDH